MGIEVEKPGSVVLRSAISARSCGKQRRGKLAIEADSKGTIVRGDRSEFKHAPSAPIRMSSRCG